MISSVPECGAISSIGDFNVLYVGSLGEGLAEDGTQFGDFGSGDASRDAIYDHVVGKGLVKPVLISVLVSHGVERGSRCSAPASAPTAALKSVRG